MDWRERIVCDPQILMGKPSIKGTRISVELMLGWLSVGWSVDQLLEAYPPITREDLLAAFAYAHELVRGAGMLRVADAVD